MVKKTIVFDFDGVIHSYSSGWQGIDVIPDAPNADVKEVIERLRAEGYEVIVASTRCRELPGMTAILDYLNKHDISVDGIASEKPPALVYVDDRAVCYRPEIDLHKKIVNFQPWRATQEGPIIDTVEFLAKELHEAGREAVEKGATVAAGKFGDPSRKFMEWDEISEDAREGRRIQARYLLERFEFSER